jgi:hypothetical protein
LLDAARDSESKAKAKEFFQKALQTNPNLESQIRPLL